jgi:hypothetical protein
VERNEKKKREREKFFLLPMQEMRVKIEMVVLIS